MSIHGLRPIAIVLLGITAGLLAPAAAFQQTGDEFLEEVREAAARGDEAALRHIVATRSLATYEWFDELLRGDRPEDAATARRLARLYDELRGDDALLRRVRLFAGWSEDQLARHAAALELKEEAKSLAYAGRLEESRASSRQALAEFERLGDPRLQAYCLINIGVTLSFEGRLRECLETFDRAGEKAERAGDRAIIAYIENNRAYALIDLGDLNGARQALLAALPISRESGERRVEAGISMMLGTIAFTLGDLDEAEQRFLSGKEIGEEIGDPEVKATAWANLAEVREQRNDTRAEEEARRQALLAARELGAPARLVGMMLDLGEMKIKRGDRSTARELLNEAREVAAGIDDPLPLSRIEWAESHFAVKARQFGKALERLDRAEAVLGESEVPAWLSSIRVQRAIVHFHRGDYEEALTSLDEAGAAAVAASSPSKRADVHRLRAYVLNAIGGVEAALREIEEALRLAEQAGDLHLQGATLRLLGKICTRLGDHEAASASLTSALELLDPAAAPVDHAYVRLELARTDMGRGREHREAAQDNIARARQIGLAADDQHLLLAADLLDCERALGEGDVGTAQETMDRARGLEPTLVEAPDRWKIHYLDGRIREGQGRGEAAVAAYTRAVEEVERMRSGLRTVSGRATALEDRILPYRALFRLHLKQGRREEAYLTARMAKARTFVERLEPANLGEFAEIRPPVSDTLFPDEIAPLASLKAFLRPGEVLLDFFLDADAIIVFVVRRDRFSVTRIALDEVNLYGLIESVRHPGSPSATDAPLTRSFETAAGELGRLLLTPLQEDLLDAKRMFVIPNAELNQVPFAALQFKGRPLIQEYSLSVLPAAELLIRARGRATKGTGAALVVGNPATGAGFEDLPGAASEARRVAGILGEPATLLLGEAAREPAIRASAEKARVIHLAAHARVDPVFPAHSFVALAPGGDEDGRWTAEEIAETKTRASLVTLSGCKTALEIGLGDPRAPGDEREGLVRAFFKAGAGGIVANLWETDDAVAQAVLPELYSRMEASSPLTALNSLQRDMLEGKLRGAGGQSLAHPFYWAGLVAYQPGLGGPVGRRAP